MFVVNILKLFMHRCIMYLKKESVKGLKESHVELKKF